MVCLVSLSTQAFAQQCVDIDGDGWGWDGSSSCRVGLIALHECRDEDGDGDGWGWNGVQSCIIHPNCLSAASDSDGDGWGWENNASCKVVDSCEALKKHTPAESSENYDRGLTGLVAGADGSIYFTSYDEEEIWTYSSKDISGPGLVYKHPTKSVRIGILGADTDNVYFSVEDFSGLSDRLMRYEIPTGNVFDLSKEPGFEGLRILVDLGVVIGDSVYFVASKDDEFRSLWAYSPISGARQLSSVSNILEITTDGNRAYFRSFDIGPFESNLYSHDPISGETVLLYTDEYFDDLKSSMAGLVSASTSKGYIQIDTDGVIRKYEKIGILHTSVGEYIYSVKLTGTGEVQLLRLSSSGEKTTIGIHRGSLLQWSEIVSVDGVIYISVRVDGGYQVVAFKEGEPPRAILAPDQEGTYPELVTDDENLFFAVKSEGVWNLWSYNSNCPE